MQAVCELLTVAGKTLDSASAQSKQRTSSYFSVMEKWMVSKTLPSRTRFMVRDLIELRRSNWIPRRAALQVWTHLSALNVRPRSSSSQGYADYTQNGQIFAGIRSPLPCRRAAHMTGLQHLF